MAEIIIAALLAFSGFHAITINDAPHFRGVIIGTPYHAIGVGVSHDEIIAFPAALEI